MKFRDNVRVQLEIKPNRLLNRLGFYREPVHARNNLLLTAQTGRIWWTLMRHRK